MIEPTPVTVVPLEPPAEPVPEPSGVVDQDFGEAVCLLKTADDGSTSVVVQRADRVIGVTSAMLEQLQGSGALLGVRLVLDTAGHFVFEHRGPSTTAPGVELFERVAVVVAGDEP